MFSKKDGIKLEKNREKNKIPQRIEEIHSVSPKRKKLGNYREKTRTQRIEEIHSFSLKTWEELRNLSTKKWVIVGKDKS